MSRDDREVAIALRWLGSPAYERLAAFAEGIGRGLADRIAAGQPIFIMLDGDVAQTLGAILREELGVASEILVIDGVVLMDFDYIDLGRIRLPSNTVPVTIKSLVFSEDPRGPRPRQRLHHHDHDHAYHGHEHGHDHGQADTIMGMTTITDMIMGMGTGIIMIIHTDMNMVTRMNTPMTMGMSTYPDAWAAAMLLAPRVGPSPSKARARSGSGGNSGFQSKSIIEFVHGRPGLADNAAKRAGFQVARRVARD